MSDNFSEALDALRTARVKALLRQPFIGTIGLRLKLKAVEYNNGNEIDTAATDGKYIFVNPKFYLACDSLLRILVFLHEVCHVMLLHPFRRKGRDHRLYNIACDYAVNLLLEDAGFKIPGDWLLDHKFKGWSSERIYSYLEVNHPPENDPHGPAGDEEGDGGPGDEPSPEPGADLPDPHGKVLDATGDEGDALSEKELKELEGKVVEDIAQANMVGK